MKHRRRFELSVDRLDWRDPSMPVNREYSMPNGQRVSTVDPEWESRYRQHRIDVADDPKWRDDPTYNLRRAKQ